MVEATSVETAPGKKKIHYAIWIFVACCCISIGGFGLGMGIMGVYIVPVSQAYGITIADFTLPGVSLGIVQMIMFPIWGQLFKKNARVCFIIGSICFVLTILTYVFIQPFPIPGLLLAGAFMGVALPIVFFISIPTLMTNWFAPKVRGRFLSISLAFTGVGTFVWAPVFTQILMSTDYKFSFTLQAILLAIFLLPACILIKRSPEEMGLKPYGYDPNDEEEERLATSEVGVKAKSAFRLVPFYMMFIALAAVSIGMGFQNTQAAWANDVYAGTDLAASAPFIGAWMISAAAAGDVVGKLAYGFLADKIGVKVTTNIFLVLFFLCFLCMWFLSHILVFVFIGAFLLGTHNGLASVACPLVTRQIFGGADYEKIYARASIGNAIIGSFSMVIVTNAVAAVGGFKVPGYYFIGIGLVLVLAIVLNIAMTYIGKLKFEPADTAPEQRPSEAAV